MFWLVVSRQQAGLRTPKVILQHCRSCSYCSPMTSSCFPELVPGYSFPAFAFLCNSKRDKWSFKDFFVPLCIYPLLQPGTCAKTAFPPPAFCAFSLTLLTPARLFSFHAGVVLILSLSSFFWKLLKNQYVHFSLSLGAFNLSSLRAGSSVM